MNRRDFFYELPGELIAQEPAARRSDSRLLRLDRRTGKTAHHYFHELPLFLSPGDCLVLNDSKVIPARLTGKNSSGSKIEMLLHERLEENVWTALIKPGKKGKTGEVLTFAPPAGDPTDDGVLIARITEMAEGGLRKVSLEYGGPFEPLLEKIGKMPLPHYIKGNRENDGERYQTVYAEKAGSVAAPTAGLHFTEDLLRQLSKRGIAVARVTLHIGLGTFRPVKTEDISKHRMHSEYCAIEASQAAIINETLLKGGRIIGVGTTSCRTLESRAAENAVAPGTGRTALFIYPGYKFKIINGMVTNFHLPESTLLMLVSAFAGRENILAAYWEAIKEKYRFYSYGDAMLIL